MNMCGAPTSTGICGQTVFADEPFCAYHSKMADGLIEEPIDEVLTPEELRATLYGRERRDHRRMDSYTLPDTCEWGESELTDTSGRR